MFKAKKQYNFTILNPDQQFSAQLSLFAYIIRLILTKIT
jgi:hypothetical protein